MVFSLVAPRLILRVSPVALISLAPTAPEPHRWSPWRAPFLASCELRCRPRPAPRPSRGKSSPTASYAMMTRPGHRRQKATKEARGSSPWAFLRVLGSTAACRGGLNELGLEAVPGIAHYDPVEAWERRKLIDGRDSRRCSNGYWRPGELQCAEGASARRSRSCRRRSRGTVNAQTEARENVEA